MENGSDARLCAHLCEGPEKQFLQRAHKLHRFLGRADVVTDITMVMKDIFFESAGDMFALRHFQMLRKPEEFGRAGSALGFANQKVRNLEEEENAPFRNMKWSRLHAPIVPFIFSNHFMSSSRSSLIAACKYSPLPIIDSLRL